MISSHKWIVQPSVGKFVSSPHPLATCIHRHTKNTTIACHHAKIKSTHNKSHKSQNNNQPYYITLINNSCSLFGYTNHKTTINRMISLFTNNPCSLFGSCTKIMEMKKTKSHHTTINHYTPSDLVVYLHINFQCKYRKAS
jgi:hypothetical protein